jgi:CO dehydrogenase maturation factor
MTISHFIMQGKGGVGKSLAASILMQYLLKQGLEVTGCDTDPVNSSLVRYEGLNVKVFDIMDDADIDPGRFDQLIGHIAGGGPEVHMVVDIGASCFVSLGNYLKQYDAFGVLQDRGHRVFIHTIIVGGVNLLDTLGNLQSLARHFTAPIVVWLNPFFGPIRQGEDSFEDFRVYQEVAGSLHGLVQMPELKAVLFARDFEEMQADHRTFEESLKTPKVFIMSRQRLVMIWRQYQEALSQAKLF